VAVTPLGGSRFRLEIENVFKWVNIRVSGKLSIRSGPSRVSKQKLAYMELYLRRATELNGYTDFWVLLRESRRLGRV
jgi:hypothetical protein